MHAIVYTLKSLHYMHYPVYSARVTRIAAPTAIDKEDLIFCISCHTLYSQERALPGM